MTGMWGFFRKLANRRTKGKSGQTTAEYIFLLVMVVMAVKMLGGNLQTRLKKVMDAAFDNMESQVQSQ